MSNFKLNHIELSNFIEDKINNYFASSDEKLFHLTLNPSKSLSKKVKILSDDIEGLCINFDNGLCFELHPSELQVFLDQYHQHLLKELENNPDNKIARCDPFGCWIHISDTENRILHAPMLIDGTPQRTEDGEIEWGETVSIGEPDDSEFIKFVNKTFNTNFTVKDLPGR